MRAQTSETVLRFDSLSQLDSWARDQAKGLSSKTLILLEGPMGSGKTTLVRHLALHMGSREASSPTFSLCNMYADSRVKIYHVDLYRIESEDELDDTGFWDLFSETDCIIIVEWPQKVDTRHWPKDWQALRWRLEAPEGQ